MSAIIQNFDTSSLMRVEEDLFLFPTSNYAHFGRDGLGEKSDRVWAEQAKFEVE